MPFSFWTSADKRKLTEAEAAFKKKAMGVPLVLQELYKRYRRFDTPADDQDPDASDLCKISGC